MKLVYVVNQRLPIEKGYGLQVAKMSEAFADCGIRVSLIAPTRRDPIKQDFFNFYSVKRNFTFKKVFSPDFYFPGELDKIAVAIKSLISALVLCFHSLFKEVNFIYSRDELPLYFLSFFKKNLIFEIHRFSRKRSFFYKRFKDQNFKVIAVSQGLKDELVKFGFKPNNILVAHDGVDLEEFDIVLSKEEARKRLGLTQNKILLGYVGQFKTMGMEKGIDVAIKSLKLLLDHINLVLVGGDNEGIDFYKEASIRENLKDQVIFAGQVKHSLIPVYLKSFDVLLMPFPKTRHYSFYMSPLKLFEYMASKRPIVATDLPSVREVLNEKNSILVERNSPKSLADGVRLILENEEMAGRLAEQAFSNVKRRTWRKRAEDILGFIKE